MLTYHQYLSIRCHLNKVSCIGGITNCYQLVQSQVQKDTKQPVYSQKILPLFKPHCCCSRREKLSLSCKTLLKHIYISEFAFPSGNLHRNKKYLQHFLPEDIFIAFTRVYCSKLFVQVPFISKKKVKIITQLYLLFLMCVSNQLLQFVLGESPLSKENCKRKGNQSF